MTWLTPFIGGIAAAIAAPTLIILYFLKLRRRDMEISTTLLWKKAIQDLQANAPFQRLRRNILLLLQLIVLAGVCVALAQPEMAGQKLSGNRQVIMIDRSGSMTSNDESDGKGGKTTRLEAAKKQAMALIDDMRDGGLLNSDKADTAMIIAFDSQGETLQSTFTSDKELLKRRVMEITARDGPTSIDEAMRLAKAQSPQRIVEGQGLMAGEPMTIQIFSDGRIPDAAKATPGPEDDVEFHRVGQADSADVGIVGIRSERSFEDPTHLSVFVSVQNNEPKERAVDVEFLIDGVGKGIKSATIPAASSNGLSLGPAAAAQAAGQEREAIAAAGGNPDKQGEPEKKPELQPGQAGVVFSIDRTEGAVVQARLRDPGANDAPSGDVMAIDDSAWLVVPPARKLAVALVQPGGNLFISSVLSGLPLSHLVELTPEQFQQRASAGTLGEFDVIILDRWLPPGAKKAAGGDVAQAPASGGAAPAGATPKPTTPAPPPDNTPDLPPGRYLILGDAPTRLSGQSSGIKVVGEAGASGIVDWRRDHPLMRSVNLDGLNIAKSRKIEVLPGSGATALAWSDAGPIIVDTIAGDVHAVVVPFDVAESDWPFNVSFVVFVAQATTYLGDDVDGGTQRQVQPGQVLSDRLPAGASGASLKLPDGTTQEIGIGADGRVVFGPLKRVGVYELSWSGAAGSTDIKAGSGAKRYYASSLLDSAESNVGAEDRVELANKQATAKAKGPEAGRKQLWPWILLAGVGVLMLEWFVYNKKVHV
ncbi:MAG: VWA domain-containing protein [Tepidisphaera sp.]|nr:VWA domain-containing protein [Tepidisphaera sp.]